MHRETPFFLRKSLCHQEATNIHLLDTNTTYRWKIHNLCENTTEDSLLVSML